ncbi:MAG: cell division protein FtsZ [Candidatus Marinimicrobia bacterium]|nr:cell division protein FtsZ [Candidatus Neomarinimicrobiota bacterium]
MFFEFDDYELLKAKIKVVGVGGAGGNALNRMIEDNLMGVEFIAVNTDAQDLDNNLSEIKLQIGKALTKGLGAGAAVDIGKQASDEDHAIIEQAISGADMVFITAGMGGGTGTGAAPNIARIARNMGILTVGIVTRPFVFEGGHRAVRAETGIAELRKHCDTTLVIPNETLLRITDPKTGFAEALKLADSILHQATKGISDLINVHGLMNLDFADVKTVMLNMGEAIMGTGIGHGEERAILAAQQAISSPLLQNCNINGARGLLVNVTGDPTITLHEVNDAASIINEEAGLDANVIFGAVIDTTLTDEFRVTVIATGFSHEERNCAEDTRDATVSLPSAASRQQSMEAVPAVARLVRPLPDGDLTFDDGMATDDEVPYSDDLEVPAILRSKVPLQSTGQQAL